MVSSSETFLVVMLKVHDQHCRRQLVEFFPAQRYELENVNQSLQVTLWNAATCQF